MAPRTFANLPKVDILGGKGEGVSTVEDDPIILPEEEDLETDPSKDIVSIELPDGSVTINIGGILNKRAERGPSGFDENLAEELSDSELARIAEDLLEAIQSDEDSRREWLDIRAAGIDLLGLKVEKPKTDTSTTSAPLEGMSNVQHPLLLEAVLRFQANASGELLPTDGPVKIRVDDFNTPNPANTPSTTSDSAPPAPQVPPNPTGNGVAPPASSPSINGAGQAPAPMSPGVQPMGVQPPDNDEKEAESLETDFNHYLTVTASEYYPDTDRMLFFVGFGGTGFKKVYNCPLRRRPVSESVDAKDLIVSNTATDLKNAGRITHLIRMRPSVVKRMQLIGAYRDIKLQEMSSSEEGPVEQKVHDIQGTQAQSQSRPKDIDRVIYETLCELDIDGYEHKDKDGDITGLPLPYKVSIDKEARKVLEIRRNWHEDDDEEYPIAKEFYVKFPFVQGLGFYDIGLLHILGNTTMALTAGWREGLDAGMFANFPGFLFAKSTARQNTNEFRVAPGSGVPIETGSMPIGQVVMPLPYKEMGAGMIQLIQNVAETGARVGGTAEIQVGEGKQDAPVGTTIALIEQATKVMDAVHKRLCQAQGHEFKLLLERFRDDPEAFWRFNRKPATQWDKEKFLRLLDNSELVPSADPNTASHMARVMRAQAVYMMAIQNPDVMDRWIAIEDALDTIKVEDPERFKAPPAPPQQDMKSQADMAKSQATIVAAQSGIQKSKIDLQSHLADHSADLQTAQQEWQAAQQESQQRSQDMQTQQQELGLKAQEQNLKFGGEAEKRQLESAKALLDAREAAKDRQADLLKTMHETSLDHFHKTEDRNLTAEQQEKDREQQQVEHDASIAQADKDRTTQTKQTNADRESKERQAAESNKATQAKKPAKLAGKK